MATIAAPRPWLRLQGEAGFFFISACIMAAVIVAGFSLQLAMGRSSFGEPIVVHLHAFAFFGWLVLYLLQNGLVAANHIALHRRLGWLALGWVPVMMVLGTIMTIVSVKHGGGPFFFDTNEFLIGNPLELYTFGLLAFWSIGVRRNTGWHRRLMFCGMALLTGPGFGRLLPMPFLIPWAWWACSASLMLFPLAGIIADLTRRGHVHPAWWAGVSVMLGAMLLTDAIAYSPLGVSVTRQVTDGTPGGVRPMHAHFPG